MRCVVLEPATDLGSVSLDIEIVGRLKTSVIQRFARRFIEVKRVSLHSV
jgi:hypothetical protein